MSDSPLSEVALQLCKKRYFQKDEQGNPIEDWKGLVTRVINHVCSEESEEYKQEISDLIYQTKFLPNTPCLVNAGRDGKASGLSACYVTTSPGDSWKGIVQNIKNFGDVARVGGGCGVSFSKIRPEGDPVFGSSHAKACGPIEAMRMVSEAMSSITQSGIRGMANMATLHVSHPDIINFIKCKQRERALKTYLKEDIFSHFDQLNGKTDKQLNIVLDKFISNFNISVVVNNAFMEAVEGDANWDLTFGGKVYRTIRAREIFDLITENAWKNGDPGLLFEDEVNNGPYKYSKQWIDATNPCVSGDTMILTTEGPIAIRDMVGKPYKVVSYNNKTKQFEISSTCIDTNRIGSFISKRQAKVITIHTANGRITCTPNHKIMTNTGFKEGKDLKIGEMILCNPCGLGVSYGLEATTNFEGSSGPSFTTRVEFASSREKWKGSSKEFFGLPKNSSNSKEPTHRMVQPGVWVEKDSTDDLLFRVDVLSLAEIFYSRETPETWSHSLYCYDPPATIEECLRREESLLSLAEQPRITAQNKAVQLRLVSITDCGESIFAQFVRVDNGDVFGLFVHDVENRVSGLHSSQRGDVQTRLLRLFKKWQAKENYRSQEQIHRRSERVQGGATTTSVLDTHRIGDRYCPICSDSFEFYQKDSATMEKVVRITEEKTLIDVYDISTISDGDNHNFIANGLIVHNCGEQPLPSNGVCNLGSIDVSKFYKESFSWKSFARAIHLAVQFLDDVVSKNVFPNDEFAAWAQDNRPIGLGIMGLADLFLKMEIAYGSQESLNMAEKLAEFMETEAHKKSVELAKERGTPKCCKFDELEHRRNVTLTSIAPTGSISMIAGCSSSIEPIFSPTIYRYDNTGSYVIAHPDSKKSYFRCAVDKDQNGKREVHWKEHILMQAAFQKYGSSGISKTCNFPNSATLDDVKQAYLLAWKTKCKGITVYRDGCKTTQVLTTDGKEKFDTSPFMPRPKEIPCDIFKAKADGFEWHVIVGKLNDKPYELFAVNGRVELPDNGTVVKIKKRHYALLNDAGETLIDNLAEEEDRISPKISLETRRFSLELRHNIPPKFIVEQIDKSTEVVTSFSKAVGRIMKRKYLSNQDCATIAEDVACPQCAKQGMMSEMIFEAGCSKCPTCSYSKCG